MVAFSKARDVGLLVVFMAILSTPLLVQLSTTGTIAENRENRRLAQAPAWPADLDAWLAFPQRFEAYFNDNFGLRDGLTWLYANALYYGLDTVPFDRVRIRSDGWMFEGLLDDAHCRDRLFTPPELDEKLAGLVPIAQDLKAEGIPYLLVLVPSRDSVYDRAAPALACPQDQTKAHQLATAMAARVPGLRVLNLHPALVEAKRGQRVYYRSDPHWTDLGAFAGYRQVAAALADLFPGLEPLRLADFEQQTRRHAPGAYGRFTNISLDDEEDVFLIPRASGRAVRTDGNRDRELGIFDYNSEEERWAQDAESMPSALVFHDSYFKQLKPWIAQHFGRTTYLWTDPQLDRILTERPSVVIHQFLSGRLRIGAPKDVGGQARP